jgi:hypothetical protein
MDYSTDTMQEHVFMLNHRIYYQNMLDPTLVFVWKTEEIMFILQC